MDPITATTTLITLVSFAKELIELGQSIAASIEKVSENRRQIRDLTQEMLRTLVELAQLTRSEELQAPALLAALGNLKAEMLHVLERCRRVSPAERRPGIHRFKRQVKGWLKRDEIEAEIRRLKEHTNKCLLMFTAFSAARIEQNTAAIVHSSERNHDIAMSATMRVEQRLVVARVESQVKLQKLERMMADVLLETSFGQGVMERTIQVIATDPGHHTLEAKYLSAQTLRLIPLVQRSIASGLCVFDPSLWAETLCFGRTGLASPEHVLHAVLGAILQVNSPAMELEFMTTCICRLGTQLRGIGMVSESVAWELLTSQILRRLAADSPHSATMLPRLARSLRRLSNAYREQCEYAEALKTSEQSVELWRYIFHTSAQFDNHVPFVDSLLVYLSDLCTANRDEAILYVAAEADGLARAHFDALFASYGEDDEWDDVDEWAASRCCQAVFEHGQALGLAARSIESCECLVEAFRLYLKLPDRAMAQLYLGASVDMLIHQVCMASESGSFTYDWLSSMMLLFRDLAARRPQDFASKYVSFVYAYLHFSGLDVPSPSSQDLRPFLEPVGALPPLPPSHPVYFAIRDIVPSIIKAVFEWTDDRIAPYILPIVQAHPDRALPAFCDIVDRLCAAPLSTSLDQTAADWLINTLLHVLETSADQPPDGFLDLLTRLWRHAPELVEYCPSCAFASLRIFWLGGYLDVARTILAAHSRSPEHSTSRLALVLDVLFAWEAGDTKSAIAAMKYLEGWPGDPFGLPELNNVVYALFVRIRVKMLRWTGRTRELRAFLRDILPDTFVAPNWEQIPGSNALHHTLLVLEDIALKREAGALEEALASARLAANACSALDPDPYRTCAQVYTLVSLGQCLATLGANDDAQAVFRRAVSLYDTAAPTCWNDFARRAEIGATAYAALADHLQLTDPDTARVYALGAVMLSRELVFLAPRYRVVLAESLVRVARVGERDAALIAKKEALDILRDLAAGDDDLPRLEKVLVGLDNMFAAQIQARMAQSTREDDLFCPMQQLLAKTSVGPNTESDDVTLVDEEDAIAGESDLTEVPVMKPEAFVLDTPTPNTHSPLESTALDKLDRPVEIRLITKPIDALWWLLIVMLGSMVTILSISVAVLLRRSPLGQI
ncbi:Tetratricopeptide repeat family [Mycena kentingensis (nom. inval.)]|nr:Tetratricopeptide repeat family [Mycena kentingensis (nom. inval.)]